MYICLFTLSEHREKKNKLTALSARFGGANLLCNLDPIAGPKLLDQLNEQIIFFL